MTTNATPTHEKKARKQQARATRKHNLEVVRRFLTEGLGPANLAVFDECLHPDIRVETGLKPQGLIEGLAEYKGIFGPFAAAFPVRRFVIDELFAAKDKVVARFTATVVFQQDYYGVAATHQVMDLKEVHVLTLHEGRVVSNVVSGTNFPFEYLMYPVLKDAVLGHWPLEKTA